MDKELSTQLLSQLRVKRAEAQKQWAAFEKARAEAQKEAKAEGKDALTYIQEGGRLDKIDEIHKGYSLVAEEVKNLEDQLGRVALWDSKGPTQPENAASGTSTSKGPENAGSMGQQFVASPQYQERVKPSGAKSGTWASGPVEFKATVTQAASPIAQPDVQGGLLPILFRRLTVADLMPSGTTESNTVRYLKETTATNAAAPVAEAALKPESTLIFSQVDEPVRKIATFLPVSDEMLEDEAQIRSYIDARLRLFIQLTEEDQLLNGNGTPPNLTGILNRAGIQTQALGADVRPDAIHKAITLIRLAFMEADGMVIEPADWEQIRLLKDSSGQYYGGGPFTGAYGNDGIAPNNLWGLRVVVTPAIATGTALVGAFGTAAQVFRRGGITVEASNSHSDFFQKNLTAIRAEERLALAVYRPSAFATVTGI